MPGKKIMVKKDYNMEFFEQLVLVTERKIPATIYLHRHTDILFFKVTHYLLPCIVSCKLNEEK